MVECLKSREALMGEKKDSSGKRVRPKTAPRGKRYLCARCRKRSPRPVFTPAPWYCANCLKPKETEAS